MSSQVPVIYILNMEPNNVSVTVSGLTPTETTINGETYTEYVPNGQTVTIALTPYKSYSITSNPEIPAVITSCNDGIQIYVYNMGQYNYEGFCGYQTVTFVIQNGSVSMQFDTPQDILQSYLYNNILKNMNSDLTKIYQDLTTLISQYASGQTLSQSLLSDASSVLQDLDNMLQNAIQFVTKTVIKSDVVSVLQQVYNNLNQIYSSLTNKTLTVGVLQNSQLTVSYSSPEASTVASGYSQFLNNAINILQNASPQSSGSSSQSSTITTSTTTSQLSSSLSSTSSSSSTSTSPTPSPPVTSSQSSSSTAPSSPLSTQASSQSSSSSPTTSPASSSATSPTSPTTSSPTLSQGQVLAQIKAGDISALLSGASEIPQNMIPVVNAVVQLYQLYGLPDGTPLSTAVERLLSDIRDAYYKITNHKQEEVNTQQLTQLLQIYNTLASNNLAPPSQSASKLSTLVQTSGVMPALPAVLGQYYPGRVYSNYV